MPFVWREDGLGLKSRGWEFALEERDEENLKEMIAAIDQSRGSQSLLKRAGRRMVQFFTGRHPDTDLLFAGLLREKSSMISHLERELEQTRSALEMFMAHRAPQLDAMEELKPKLIEELAGASRAITAIVDDQKELLRAIGELKAQTLPEIKALGDFRADVIRQMAAIDDVRLQLQQRIKSLAADSSHQEKMISNIQKDHDLLKDSLLPQIDALEIAKSEIMDQLAASTSDGTRREERLGAVQRELDRLKDALLPQIDALEKAKNKLIRQLGATTAEGTIRERKLNQLVQQIEIFDRMLSAAEVDIDILGVALAEIDGDLSS